MLDGEQMPGDDDMLDEEEMLENDDMLLDDEMGDYEKSFSPFKIGGIGIAIRSILMLRRRILVT